LRVPDLVLKSIGFVAEVLGPDLSAQSLDPIATAFLVSIPSKVRGGRFHYAVTARHVFEETPNTEKVIIVNKKGGGVKALPTLGRWYCHEDKSVDVLVAPVHYDSSVDVTAFDMEFCFDESSNAENIGPGDEVFFPGLFTAAPGIDRILPMVRHGNIAMLPTQQIQTKNGFADIYLIEARSIGGLSGSPVFARETVVLPAERHDKRQVMIHGGGIFKLLGLIKGHWDVDESRMNQAYFAHDSKRGVNMGIAQVVPVKKIIETINCPDLVEDREGAELRYLLSREASLD
jgi:hypothetical protein